jgi:hypothetical protein
VTFTPDGSGVNDTMALRVHLDRAARHRLEVYRWKRGEGWQRITAHHWQAAGKLVREFSWNGADAAGTQVPDGPYVVTVCTPSPLIGSFMSRSVSPFDEPEADDDHDEDAPAARASYSTIGVGRNLGVFTAASTSRRCLEQPVIAHVRRLSASLPAGRGYLPGQVVPLVVHNDGGQITLGIFPDNVDDHPAALWSAKLSFRHTSFTVPSIGPGLYRLRVSDAAGNHRWLPLVVRTRAFPVSTPPPKTALIVWPFLTWRAYNKWDANRNGIPDTWYERWTQRQVTLNGPYEQHLKSFPGAEGDYSSPHLFMDWLTSRPHRNFQMVTDLELGRMSQVAINHYSAVLFPGHTEYYEPATYDRMLKYRNAGGHLVFLSANNFFRTVRVSARTNAMILTNVIARSRVRSDYALTGIGFQTCCFARSLWPMSRFTDPGAVAAPWLLTGTGLKPGDAIGYDGVEIDDINAQLTPKEVRLVAIGIVPGSKRSVIAYGSFERGGEVLSFGNMVFLRWLGKRHVRLRQQTRILLDNVWTHMVTDQS